MSKFLNQISSSRQHLDQFFGERGHFLKQLLQARAHAIFCIRPCRFVSRRTIKHTPVRHGTAKRMEHA